MNADDGGATGLDLSTVEALTFDCYGTLIDWDRGLGDWLTAWARRTGAPAARADLLARFARWETRVQQADPRAPYPEVLARVGRAIAAELGVPWTVADGTAFGASIGAWPPFPDAPGALAALKRRYRLVVVSNVDLASFRRSNALLGVAFDAVVTAEEVGAYKPDPAMFLRAFEVLEGMGVPRARVLHVAQSLYHDVAPAHALGLPVVWVHRRTGGEGQGASAAAAVDVSPDLEVSDLAELAARLGV